jgi:hypothetical protein
MSVRVETSEPSRLKLINADRLVTVALGILLLGVQAGWAVLLLWAGLRLFSQ